MTLKLVLCKELQKSLQISVQLTASVAAPRAWNRLPTELKLLRSTDLFRRDLKIFLFHSVYRIRIDSVMRPRSSSRRRNTSASVTVTAHRCSDAAVA